MGSQLHHFFQWAGNDEIYTKPKRAFVKLPKYEDKDLFYLAIHFFPNDTIKAFVTAKTPDYPDYPYGWAEMMILNGKENR